MSNDFFVEVRSITMAESLCCDYPFFRDLVERKLDETDPKHKKHIWIFRRSNAIDEAIKEISIYISNAKKEYQNKLNEGNMTNDK